MEGAIRYQNPPGAGPAQGLYSHVTLVPVGPIVHIAGQLSIDGTGRVVGERDTERQIRQVYENLGIVLKGLGLDYNNIIKFTTYLVHAHDIDVFMRVRADLFPKLFDGKAYPPNTLLIVNRLVKEEFLVEIEAVAFATPTDKMRQ